MTAVGDLLAFLHDGDRLVRTFEGEFRDWVQPAPSNVLAMGRRDTPVASARWSGAGLFPRASDQRRAGESGSSSPIASEPRFYAAGSCCGLASVIARAGGNRTGDR
jgi:hypothetical protein